MTAIRSYGGSDVELEGHLRHFYKSTENPLIPLETVAVAPKFYSQDELSKKSATEVSRNARQDYPTLLERLKEKAEERAESLDICKLDDTYLTNISFDEKTKVMKGDIFEPRCQSTRRPAQLVKTYSGSAERLKEVLQRQLRPIEHFAIAIGNSKNYVEALEELRKYAKSLIENRKLTSNVYVANINFRPEEEIIIGDILEVGEYSTACELIV